MPTIRLSGAATADVQLEINERSALARYFKLLTSLGVEGLSSAALGELPLDAAPLREAQVTLTSLRPLELALGRMTLEIPLGVAGHVRLLTPQDRVLFGAQTAGDPVAIAQDELWLVVGFDATVTVRTGAGTGPFSAGLDVGTSVRFANRVRFDAAAPPRFVDALGTALAGFVIPADAEDLRSLAPGRIATIDGSGTVTVDASFDVAVRANPLLDVTLPDPAGAVRVKSLGSLGVGAAVALSGRQQWRVQAAVDGRVSIGLHRRRDTSLSVEARVAGGLTSTSRAGDLLTKLLRAISPDPALDAQQLEAQGVGEVQVQLLEDALTRGLDRRLQLVLSTTLSRSGGDTETFLFDVWPRELGPEGEAVLRRMLAGELALAAGPRELPAGIVRTKSAVETTVRGGLEVRANLLGIVNVERLADLLASSKVVVEPATGDWVVTDQATATRLLAITDNFARSQRIRALLADRFLITAAWHCAHGQAATIDLTLAHSTFAQHGTTNRRTMRDMLHVIEALGLAEEADEAARLGESTEFGDTLFVAEALYDADATRATFLDGERPRVSEEFERVGRAAMSALVRDGDPDRHRRPPLVDDALWARMRAAGPFHLADVDGLRGLDVVQLAQVSSDYVVIVWWADAMARLAARAAAVRAFLAAHGAPDVHDAELERLRRDLARSLAEVARDTREQFGEPWGLIAMAAASGGRARTRALVAGSRLALQFPQP